MGKSMASHLGLGRGYLEPRAKGTEGQAGSGDLGSQPLFPAPGLVKTARGGPGLRARLGPGDLKTARPGGPPSSLSLPGPPGLHPSSYPNPSSYPCVES